MAPGRLPFVDPGLLRRSLRLFLPISGAITLVLLPMVALYETSRRETLQARGSSLVQAGSLRVQSTLRELRANTGVVTAASPMTDLLSASPSASVLQRQRLEAVLRTQRRVDDRFRALAVIGTQGQLLAQAIDSPLLLPAASVRTALRHGQALHDGQIWLSTVQWPAAGRPSRAPELLVVRPLFSPAGTRRALLLAVVSLASLAGDFNLITNADPALQRGYLLSREGRAINAAPGSVSGMSFAAQHPQVWRRMQREPRGVVSTGSGLFVFDSGWGQHHLGVVIQLRPSPLVGGSVFAQPLGQALVALLYLLVGAFSVGLSLDQQNLAALQEQERQLQQRLQTVLRSAGVGMFLCDPLSGRFLSANDALCAFFGRSEADLLNHTWQELTHPEDLAADQRMAQRLLRGELDRYRLRKRCLRPDGSSVWGDLVLACSRNVDGSIRDLIGQISDVSELVAKSAYLEAAASAGVVGVWDWDVPRDVLTWDPVMFRLYGLFAEDAPRTREAWEQAVHPDDQSFVLGELQAALRGWRDFQPHFRVVWPDGSVHHLQARSRTSFGADGMPLRMIGVNYDITEEVERQQELEDQRQLLATSFDALVDPLLVLSLDDIRSPRDSSAPELRIAELNAAAARFFGRSQSQLLGQPLERLLPVACNSDLHAALLAVARGGSPLLADAQPVRLNDGTEPCDLELQAVAVRTGLVLSFRDITEQRRAAVRLAASEDRFRLLAENASDVVFRISLDGVTEWITPSVTPLLGWDPANLIDRPFAVFVHPDDRALLQEADAALRRGERRQFRLRVQRREGDYRWIGLNARGLVSEQGEVVGIIGSWRDVQAEMEAETELDRRARIDPLTGLFNRQEILERLDRLTRHRRQGDAAVGVLFCDIDHFKDINDRHGHGGGDAVLHALAQRLRSSTRLGDLVGRLGGDELLVVLQAMPSLDVAMAIADKVHGAAREPLQLPTGEVVPTLSIGVTLVHPDEPVDAVVSRADQAMYWAKQAGRDRVVAFS